LTEQTNTTALKSHQSAHARFSLSFTHTHQGDHKLNEVTRQWQAEQDETLTLTIKGVLDTSLNSEQVQAFLHE
ncbi:DNA sulfur modification protein DndD, partial [Pseudoalteromonas sp. S4488]